MERQQAIEAAQARIIETLKADRFSCMRNDDITNPVAYEILDKLVDARDDVERHARDIKDSIDRSLPYVRGESASWNNLGMIQSSAPSLEMAVARFSELSQLAKIALVDHYLAS